MRIKHRYLRNRHFKIKAWRRVRAKSHPFQRTHTTWYLSTEERIKGNFEWIETQARVINSGGHTNWCKAPASYSRAENRKIRSKEHNAMYKINNGCYDVEVPLFKRDADWTYF